MIPKRLFLWSFLVLITLTLSAWIFIGRPNSLAEYRFLQCIALLEKLPGSPMNLATLMEGNWELACDAHGYSGDFYLKKYARTYPAIGALHDRAWCIVFINSDGSYTTVSGNCKTGIRPVLPGCISRTEAVLHATANDEKCVRFR